MLLENLAGALEDLREPGEARHVDAITLAGRALLDGVEKDDALR